MIYVTPEHCSVIFRGSKSGILQSLQREAFCPVMSGLSAVFGRSFPLFAHFVPYKDLMYRGLFASGFGTLRGRSRWCRGPGR